MRTPRSFSSSNAVTAALAEANIAVIKTSPDGATTESAYSTQLCSASFLYTAPVANQCCWSNSLSFGGLPRRVPSTLRRRANRSRQEGPYGGCKTQSGGSCTSNCYYGPLGFSAAVVTAGGANAKIRSVEVGVNPTHLTCRGTTDTSPPEFANVTGSQPLGQTCCRRREPPKRCLLAILRGYASSSSAR